MTSVQNSQRQKILRFLASGKQLTVAEANRLGVNRLSARIHDLRNEGFVIYTNQKKMKGGPRRGQKVTAYRLDNADQDFVLESGVV